MLFRSSKRRQEGKDSLVNPVIKEEVTRYNSDYYISTQFLTATMTDDLGIIELPSIKNPSSYPKKRFNVVVIKTPETWVGVIDKKHSKLIEKFLKEDNGEIVFSN